MNKSRTLYVQTGKLVTKDAKVEKAKQKLEALAHTPTVLCQVESAFPFQVFPDKIIIEKDKVTVVHRTFAWKNIFPIPIANLNGVNVTRDFLFASLAFELSGFESNPDPVTHIWPAEAAKAKRYILGLINAYKQEIDVMSIPLNELRANLEEIGRTTGEIETLPIA